MQSSAPLQPESGEVVITYTYDSLYRLTAADYSTGEYYHYTYDMVGNRLTEQTQLDSTTYAYDIANRLVDVDGVTNTWDNNGNMLDDGTNTYAYDAANRLTSVLGPSSSVQYSYNGLGDRYQQTVDSQTTTYALDLNVGLTQVLDDGDNTYLYGVGRISQVNTGTQYFMGDALGSVRQLVEGGDILLAKSYTPYGEVLFTVGGGTSPFAYTGEQIDPNGLVYLRARYYQPADGRFLSRDTWGGNINHPVSLNKWAYANGNPIYYTDPSGHDGILPPTTGAIAYCLGLAVVVVVDGPALEALCLLAGGTIIFITIVGGNPQIIDSIVSGCEEVLDQVTKIPNVVTMKGEYVPPGLNEQQRGDYRDAVHRYKNAHGIPRNVDVPKDILDKIAESIKRGLSPQDAADRAPGPPEEDWEDTYDDP
jgi:RHS repeat-associated protein